MNSLVSIIVPVYNAEKYLPRCIDSILGQSFSDFELLLINDGSKDHSGKICDGYAANDSRVHVFHKENGGASAARNYGLDNATGKYVCFVDADDWVDKDYLKQLLPNEEEEMVVCSIRYEGNTNKNLCISYKKRNKECIESTLHQMIDHMAVCSPCCKIMRRDIIERNQIRFDTDVSAGEDMLFICDYFSAGLEKIRTLSLPLYHYYVDDNESLSHRIVDFETTEYVLDCIKERIDKLSGVYDWNNDDGYKRHISTQLNNFIAYIKSIPSYPQRVKLLKKVIENKHVRILLADTDYMVKRKRLNGLKALLFRMSIIPIRLYYLFK